MTAIQNCPNLYFDDKNIICYSNSNNDDLSKYVVSGAGVVIQVF